MKETSKTNKYRTENFFQKYLNGNVIDIGCGDDPISAKAEPFDTQHGDANRIDKLRPNNYYETVYSSHCLEHMKNVELAILSWWKLVKIGGHLIFVVPDENLYEQGHWPSIFNKDHKASFRQDKSSSWSPVSYNIEELVKKIPGANLISSTLQDFEYDYSLQSFKRPLKLDLHEKTLKSLQKSKNLKIGSKLLTKIILQTAFWLGNPVDQTAGYASAQIQVILQKT